jgi:hypothetical protein
MGRKIKSNSDQASLALSVQAVDVWAHYFTWDRVCQNPGHHERVLPATVRRTSAASRLHIVSVSSTSEALPSVGSASVASVAVA